MSVLDGAIGPQLPKKRKYPLQVDYQLDNYFKPSHLSSKKFRRKLSYKLETFVIYSNINFEMDLTCHIKNIYGFDMQEAQRCTTKLDKS